MKRYDVGDRVRVYAEFRNEEGVPAAPTTIVARVKPPVGNVVSYTYGSAAELVQLSAGSYYIDIDVSAPGEWYYRWEGTGDVVAAGEGQFIGLPTEFGGGD